MANWSILKTAIADVIRTNGNQEITGQVLQSALNSMINTLGEYPDFAGVATPTTAPGVFDGPVFFLAATPGNYPNFSNITLNSGELVILRYGESIWVKEVLLEAASMESVEALIEALSLAFEAQLEEVRSSVPIADSTEQGTVDIRLQGISRDFTVVYLKDMSTFAAKVGSLYYSAWPSWGPYTPNGSYTLTSGRAYTIGGKLYVWNGSEMLDMSTPIINDLTTGGADKALSAEMGKELEGKVIESDGGRDFLVKEVDNTSSDYIVYNRVIPKSKAVRFELKTKTAVLSITGKNNPVDLRLTLSDSSTLTVKSFYFNDKPYTYFSENLYITKIICGSGKNVSEQNGTVELKVSIGEYAEKMYFREKVSEDISIAIPTYKILNNRVINREGIVTNLSGQPNLYVYIYDISEYVGKTLKINGYYPVSGVTYYLWSISSSDTFDNTEDILAHSYKHRVNSASINEYDEYHNRDIVYIEPNYRYLAVAINTDVIQGKLYGCFELMNKQESINYLQESINYLQDDLDKVTEIVEKNEEKIQQITGTIAAGFDTDIIYWGHSLVVGNQDGKGVNIENTVQSIIGGTFINAGIGGETTNDYAFRQGGATLVIPAGSINGTYNELYDTFETPLASLGRQPDIGNTINPLVLSNGKTCNITSENGNWLISGYDGPTTTYPLEARSKGSLYKGKILVLWPGANGTALSQNTDRPFSQPTQAQVMYVDSMIAHHGTDKYVIIGYTGTTTEQDPASYWDLTASLNLKYGNKFINARQELCEYGLAINGLTPNEHVAKIYNEGVQERTLLNVISVSEIKSGTIHVEMTDGGESVLSVDGNGVNIPRTTSYSLNGTTLTYTSSYRVSVENELTQLAGKHLPSRLVYDTVHLSHYGYFALGTIIAHRMIALGYDKLIGD